MRSVRHALPLVRYMSPENLTLSGLNHPALSEHADVWRTRITASSSGAFDASDPAGEGAPSGGPPPAGPVPERFEIGEIAASGGMGRVYRAYDRDLNREVALTIIDRGGFGREIIERWRRQNEVLKRLNQPALPPALDIGSTGESCWVAVPAFKGQSLADRLRAAGPMPARDAAALVAELAEALQLAHEHGLVHGDLKPHYVFLCDDGQPMLLGVGELPLRTEKLRQGDLVGTPAYMAPEHIRGETNFLDPQSEVYSLGVILYEVLTGGLPFSATRAFELLKKALNEEPKRPRKVVRSIPAQLEAICLKAMAKDRSQRFATAGELAAALRCFLAPARRRGFWKAK